MPTKKIFYFLTIFALLSAAPASAEKFEFNEISLKSGYMLANLKSENSDELEMYPIILQFGIKINELLGLENHKGTIHYVIEPFAMHVTAPDTDFAAGISFNLKYSYPLTEKISTYIDIGAGPMYFGADTFEQGGPGFNFLDHGGAGVSYDIGDNKAVTLGYRYVHISDLGIGDGPNAGINANTYLLGITQSF